jgi:hypothetical protein
MHVKINKANVRTWLDLVDDDTGLDSVNCKIEESYNGGSTYSTLQANTPNIGSYSWTPTSVTNSAYLKITGIGGTPSIITIGPIKVSLKGPNYNGSGIGIKISTLGL